VKVFDRFEELVDDNGNARGFSEEIVMMPTQDKKKKI